MHLCTRQHLRHGYHYGGRRDTENCATGDESDDDDDDDDDDVDGDDNDDDDNVDHRRGCSNYVASLTAPGWDDDCWYVQSLASRISEFSAFPWAPCISGVGLQSWPAWRRPGTAETLTSNLPVRPYDAFPEYEAPHSKVGKPYPCKYQSHFSCLGTQEVGSKTQGSSFGNPFCGSWPSTFASGQISNPRSIVLLRKAARPEFQVKLMAWFLSTCRLQSNVIHLPNSYPSPTLRESKHRGLVNPKHKPLLQLKMRVRRSRRSCRSRQPLGR